MPKKMIVTKKPRPPSLPSSAPKFSSTTAAGRYKHNFGTRPVICERPVVISDFSELGIEQIFTERGWLSVCRMSGTAYVEVVREFFSNATIFDHCIRSTVRGVSIYLDSDVIRAELSLPDGEFQYPTSAPLPDINDYAGTVLIKGERWKGNMMPHARLTSVARMLHLFCLYNVTLKTRHSSISLDRAFLLHAMLSGVSIDLAAVIYDSILSAAQKEAPREGLPFGIFLTNLCTQSGVRVDASEPSLTS